MTRGSDRPARYAATSAWGVPKRSTTTRAGLPTTTTIRSEGGAGGQVLAGQRSSPADLAQRDAERVVVSDVPSGKSVRQRDEVAAVVYDGGVAAKRPWSALGPSAEGASSSRGTHAAPAGIWAKTRSSSLRSTRITRGPRR